LYLPNKSYTTYIKKYRDRENFSCSTFDKKEIHFKETIEIGKKKNKERKGKKKTAL